MSKQAHAEAMLEFEFFVSLREAMQNICTSAFQLCFGPISLSNSLNSHLSRSGSVAKNAGGVERIAKTLCHSAQLTLSAPEAVSGLSRSLQQACLHLYTDSLESGVSFSEVSQIFLPAWSGTTGLDGPAGCRLPQHPVMDGVLYKINVPHPQHTLPFRCPI